MDLFEGLFDSHDPVKRAQQQRRRAELKLQEELQENDRRHQLQLQKELLETSRRNEPDIDIDFEEGRGPSHAPREAREVNGGTHCPGCSVMIPFKAAYLGDKFIHYIPSGLFSCPGCQMRLKIDEPGIAQILGASGEPLGKFDDPRANPDHLCSRCQYFLSLWKRRLKRIYIVIAILIVLTFAVYCVTAAMGGSICWGLCPAVPLIFIWIYGLVASIFSIESSFCLHPEIKHDDVTSINRNNQCRYWLTRDSITCHPRTVSPLVGTQERSSVNEQKMFIVTCDCGKKYKVGGEHVGKNMTCKCCGRTLK